MCARSSSSSESIIPHGAFCVQRRLRVIFNWLFSNSLSYFVEEGKLHGWMIWSLMRHLIQGLEAPNGFKFVNEIHALFSLILWRFQHNSTTQVKSHHHFVPLVVVLSADVMLLNQTDSRSFIIICLSWKIKCAKNKIYWRPQLKQQQTESDEERKNMWIFFHISRRRTNDLKRYLSRSRKVSLLK